MYQAEKYLGNHKSPAHDSICPKQEHGDANAVANMSRRATQKQIAEKAMTVRAHCHQVATHLFDPFDDFLRWFTVSQFCLGRNARGSKFRLNPVQLGGIFRDFRADRVRPKGARGPTVGYVQ